MKITDLDEGFGDLISRGAQALGLGSRNMANKGQANMQDVAQKAKELKDRGMSDQQIVQALQQEFGVLPNFATQALRMVQAGLVETNGINNIGNVDMKERDNFDLSPQQRKLANLGRVLMDQATTSKNDELANVMAKVGNELTNFGATFGPKNLKDLVSKTDVPAPVIQKLIAYAQKIQDAQSNLNKDHQKGGLNDSISETTSAGSVASVAAPVGGLISRQPRNSNGTARNALDSDNNLMGGPKKNKKSKKA